MKKLLIAICLTTTAAMAGHDTGAGGMGVLVKKDTVYLYDFVEAGIEESVYIDEQITDEMKAAPVVKANLLISRPAQDLVIAKLNEIYRLSPTYAQSLIQGIKDYQWRFVRPNLNGTNDIGRTPIRTSLDQVQVAFRDDVQKVVTIDKQNLDKMPTSHQAGLYFHELIYAQTGAYDSYKARLLTSFIFHPSFQFTNFEQFRNRVNLAMRTSIEIVDYQTYTTLNSDEFKNKCSIFATASRAKIKAALILTDATWKELQVQHSNGSQGSYGIYPRREDFFETAQTYTLDNESFKFMRVWPVNMTRYKHRDILPSTNSRYYSLPVKKQKELEALKSSALSMLNSNRDEYYNKCLPTWDLDVLERMSQINVWQN